MILSAFLIDLKCRWLQTGLVHMEKHQTLAFLIDLKCRWLQTGLVHMEKHQTLAFLLIVDFYAFLK